jgi:hypothetical protein
LRKDTGIVDHPASGRFVRNVALSLSGGALLTLLGAGAAHAQDASTQSAGLGATGTGDATALGNHSGSTTTQGGTISGAQGSVQVITQTGGINNNGVAVANTGGNTATGNSSTNSANALQNGQGGAGAAVNNGQAANGSNGIAFVTTGNASAVGNESSTTLTQTTSARGALGGILVLTQDSTVTNSGRAFAGTGGNDATGNDSSNDAGLDQGFLIGMGLGSNSGKATNDSDGRATIATGNASAMGNVSESSVTQSSNGAAGGDDGAGGLILIPQTAEITNRGRARATTGGNDATGNESTNGVDVFQRVGDPDNIIIFFANDPGLASNSAEAANWSSGTADIATGDAGAVGNQSSSSIRQSAESDLTEHGGLTLLPQAARIDNLGRARANTGGNEAIGNESQNAPLAAPGGADVDQIQGVITIPDFPGFFSGTLDSGVGSNTAQAANNSDGRATVTTGDAVAAGNRSTSDLSQTSTANASTTNIYPQVASITNAGSAFAGTGANEAFGNDSTSNAYMAQNSALPSTGFDRGVVSNAARSSSTSDGAASITTGSASAVGNESGTALSQVIDPIGLVLPVQAAAVVNAGNATALTGANTATGNSSFNNSSLEQDTFLFSQDTFTPTINVGLGIDANQGQSTNTSDGTASIATGSAAAVGNESNTTLAQQSTGTVEGLGLVVNTQAAAVLNAGTARATTGGNRATGNRSDNETPNPSTDASTQLAGIGSFNSNLESPITVNTPLATVANSGTAENASDGTATIETGSARATGTRSATRVGQSESGTVSGIGAIINTQAAGVVNAGAADANTGGNRATGNRSINYAEFDQDAEVGDGNVGVQNVVINAVPTITASNSATASNASDGTADIDTGSADALGNASTTDVSQDPGNTVSGLGLVVSTQVAGVANLGAGTANTGLNRATGNASRNLSEPNDAGAELDQTALIEDGNRGGDVIITAFGPMTAANQGLVGNASDGTARIRTGGAQAQGNVSTTSITQAQEGSISDLGVVIDTQVAGVANVGVAAANSGGNRAIGNISANLADESGADGEFASIATFETGGPLTLTSFGPMTANNAGTLTNSSDGTAQIGTGSATASGNVSSTDISQHQVSAATDGIDVGTQVAGVANVGLGVANSGANRAIGNASGFIDPATLTFGGGTPNTATSQHTAALLTSTPAPTDPVIVLGPATAANEAETSNSSDGEACVCTGDAVASGNISSTTLTQELDTSVGAGAVVLTEAAGVLNAGVGVANSGLNRALGNVSQNLADSGQNATANSGLAAGGVVGPQTVHNGGGATNASDGTGKVGTGKATATGNKSTTTFVQAAAVDSDLAVATIAGGTTNTGLGLANSGRNLGVGNASVNVARLDQAADGAGLVSNQGTASNESDGQGLVGNPDCLVPGVPGAPKGPTTPGVSSLPKTGAPLEVEAAVGLMLLLAGFGLRRRSASLT